VRLAVAIPNFKEPALATAAGSKLRGKICVVATETGHETRGAYFGLITDPAIIVNHGLRRTGPCGRPPNDIRMFFTGNWPRGPVLRTDRVANRANADIKPKHTCGAGHDKAEWLAQDMGKEYRCKKTSQ